MNNRILRIITQTNEADWARSAGLFLIRFSFGAMMLFGHGWPKWLSYSIMSVSFPDPIGIGGSASFYLVLFAEVISAFLVTIGLFTRLALVPLIVAMGVALFIVHGADPFAVKELALAYLLVYIMLILTGPGKISLDYYLNKKLTRK